LESWVSGEKAEPISSIVINAVVNYETLAQIINLGLTLRHHGHVVKEGVVDA
jgi:hypothetical protein